MILPVIIILNNAKGGGRENTHGGVVKASGNF